MKQWGGSQSKLWLSGMDIVLVVLGWCRDHNGSSVPLKCCSDNGLASHAFRKGASSFTETLSWLQTLFPLAALIPCPAKLSSRDAVAVSFDVLHRGFRNCFESTWGQESPFPPYCLLSSHHTQILSVSLAKLFRVHAGQAEGVGNQTVTRRFFFFFAKCFVLATFGSSVSH